jgi:putative membrane-bound dehydrogenase-like protein
MIPTNLRHGIGAATLLGAALPAFAQDIPAPVKRVLVYTVSAGFEHDVAKRPKPDELCLVERALVDLGAKTHHFEAVPRRDPESFTPSNLATFDLVFFYTTGELPLNEDQRKALFDFVKSGHAFAGAHCASDTFYKVPEYGEMLGAYFDGHPWSQEIRVKVEDREHPAARLLGDVFSVKDEIYQFKDPYDRKKLHVILSLDTSSVDVKKEGVHRKDGDFALAWCKDYDKGRVFYTALGHEPALWTDARYLTMLDGGFRWAMRMTDAAGAVKVPRAKEAGKEPKKEEKKDGEKPPKQALPIVHEGFAVDLIAEAPEILWPSSNACLPDGSLLFGEDRMDMPGPVGEPLDRVIRFQWKEGGGYEKTVFADHLYAVMGMAEVDGAVYVMNMPHLTRLEDADGDGVAEKRTEILTDLGPSSPPPGGFNDHIVSGIRLGMDGYLYVAVGDKGIPGAHGTDGRTLQLHGGGVVRVKPDGSGLEIVASGLRNFLDVAIDERGEMFTYDNTDDGLGWWTRLSHIVVGGYYGYPWDYHEHQDRMLPCMAEYGGGSPTGGLAYREPAWPEEFRDNLFFCEWGKGALRRFVLEPDGATFKVQVAEDFVKAGDVPAFKPLDVCESPDGRFLYLSDWGYDGWTNPKEAGRLWRIRRADDDPAKPSVAKPLPNDVDGLVAALDDPSFGLRLRAQRALSRIGRPAVEALRGALNASRSERSARHALWALSAIDRHELDWAERTVWYGRADSCKQLARAFSEGEDGLHFDPLNFLEQPDLDVRRDAIAAIGAMYRNGRANASLSAGRAKALARALPANGDPFVRFALRRTLRELPIPADLADGSAKPELVMSYLPVLRGLYREDVAAVLTGVLDAKFPPEIRVQALDLLGDLHRKPEPWDGKWWSIQPAKTPPPPHVVAWESSERIEKAVRGSLADGSPEVRRAALEALRAMDDRDALPAIRARWEKETAVEIRALLLDVLGALKDEGAKPLLESVVRDPKVDDALRKRAIEAACAIRTPSMVELLASIAGDPNAPAAHAVPCLLALGRLKESSSSGVVLSRLAAGDEKIRIAAASAIVDVDAAKAAQGLEPLLRDPATAVRVAALAAFGRLKLAGETPKLLPLVDDEATRDEAILALAAAPDRRALQAFLAGLDRKQKPVQDASRQALSAVRDDVRAELESMCTQGKLGETQLAAIQTIYEVPQPILDWKIAGPFPRRKEPARDALASLAWKEHRAESKDGFVDLVALLSGAADVGAYAQAEVRSASDREAAMAVGSDDSVSVWVNGELAHDFPDNRAWSADQDRFRVKLRAGANTILLLVGNTTGGWSFNAKISGDPTGPLFARKVNRPDLEEYRKFVLGHPGDPARGFAIFRRSKDEAMCIRCHTVFGTGEKIGPDLSDIGAKYGKEEILASILTPSQRIAEGYRSTSIELEDGRVLFGMVQKETKDEILLYDTNGELKTIDVSDVASRKQLDTSVMPDGLWSTLSKEDLADLVAWLTTLRGAPGGK